MTNPDDDRRSIATGYLACGLCGIAAPVSQEFREPRTFSEYSPAGREIGQKPVTFTRCEHCTVLESLASKIVTSHPRMPAQMGPDVAHDITLGMLIALTVLRRPFPARDTPDRDMAALVRNLGRSGLAIRWTTRLSLSTVNSAAPMPWSVASEDDLARLRTGYSNVLAERVAAITDPSHLSPPPINPNARTSSTIEVSDGCLICGVATITVDALKVIKAGGPDKAAKDAWTPRSLSPAALGGRASPTSITGHTCPACELAITEEGATGPASLERAVLTFIDAPGRHNPNRDWINGLVGYGFTVARAQRNGQPTPPPNITPWAHIDLNTLRDEVNAPAPASTKAA